MTGHASTSSAANMWEVELKFRAADAPEAGDVLDSVVAVLGDRFSAAILWEADRDGHSKDTGGPQSRF